MKNLSKGICALSLMIFTSACAGDVSYTKIQGERIQGEIVRSPGGVQGDDVTSWVLDKTDYAGAKMTTEGTTTSTSFAKLLMPALIPGVAVARMQQKIAEYQVDNQCTDQCGDVINVLSQSESAALTQVQVDAIANILQGGTQPTKHY